MSSLKKRKEKKRNASYNVIRNFSSSSCPQISILKSSIFFFCYNAKIKAVRSREGNTKKKKTHEVRLTRQCGKKNPDMFLFLVIFETVTKEQTGGAGKPLVT